MKFVSVILCLFIAFSCKAQLLPASTNSQLNKREAKIRNSKYVKTEKKDSVILVSKEIYDDTTACFPMSKDRLYNIYDYVINLNDIHFHQDLKSVQILQFLSSFKILKEVKVQTISVINFL